MKLQINFVAWLVVTCSVSLLWWRCAANSSQTTISVKHTKSHDPAADGFWDRKVTWKSRWVKHWRPKAIYVPVWKKVWSPVVQNEWVPLPKPPPGWDQKPHGIVSAGGWSSSSSGNGGGSAGKVGGWKSGGWSSSSAGYKKGNAAWRSGRGGRSWSSSRGRTASGGWSTSGQTGSGWKGITRTIAQEVEF